MDDGNNDNVFKFGVVENDKKEDDKIPQNDYYVRDIEDNEFDVNGFLIFTPHHLAIMTDDGQGAIPALVLPISRVKVAVLATVIEED